MIAAGPSAEQAAARTWPVDKQGLLFDDAWLARRSEWAQRALACIAVRLST